MLTTKQRGDAGEMLVAAQLTLHGIPAYTVPAHWPAYDIAADLSDGSRTTISVKTRTNTPGNGFNYADKDQFDWLAVVVLGNQVIKNTEFIVPRFFIAPRKIADERAWAGDEKSKPSGERGWLISSLIKLPPSPFPGLPTRGKGGWGLADFENNFILVADPTLLQLK